jgi:hypothetical protein
MSIKTTITVTCVHCGAKHRIAAYPIVHVQENPRLAQKVIDGTFYTHKCNKCGNEYDACYSGLYRDDEKCIIICYSVDTQEQVETNCIIDERRAAIGDEARDPYWIRAVQSPNALREKARLFSMGLDDRIIEIMKVNLLEIGQENGTLQGQPREVLCWAADDGTLYFDFISQDYEMFSTEVSRDVYDIIYDECIDLLTEQCPNPTSVGLEFAVEFLVNNDLSFY